MKDTKETGRTTASDARCSARDPRRTGLNRRRATSRDNNVVSFTESDDSILLPMVSRLLLVLRQLRLHSQLQLLRNEHRGYTFVRDLANLPRPVRRRTRLKTSAAVTRKRSSQVLQMRDRGPAGTHHGSSGRRR